MECKALVVPAAGAKPGFVTVETAGPGPGEVTVTTRVSVVSPGTERARALGMPDTPRDFPYHAGYCSAGTVSAVGPGVGGPGAVVLKAGDRVAVRTGHRSAVTVPASFPIPLLTGVDFLHGAFLPLGQVGLQGVRKARIRKGESVLVLGLGLIGRIAMKVARVFMAGTVLGADRSPERLAAARAEWPAGHILDTADPGWQEKLKALTGGHGPDITVEVTGLPELIPVACRATRRLGRVVLLSSTRGETTMNFYRDVHKPGLTLIGAHTDAVPEDASRPGLWTMKDEAAFYQELVAAGRLDLSNLVTHRVPAPEVIPVYESMLAGDPSVLGIVLDWS